jgi:hypothetical protein
MTIQPDAFRVPIDIAIERISVGRPKLNATLMNFCYEKRQC